MRPVSRADLRQFAIAAGSSRRRRAHSSTSPRCHVRRRRRRDRAPRPPRRRRDGAARRPRRLLGRGRRPVGARQPAGALHRALRTAPRARRRRAGGARRLGDRERRARARPRVPRRRPPNGPQHFDSRAARMIATLAALASVILSIPTLAHTFHAPAAPHGRTLSLICAGVLIVALLRSRCRGSCTSRGDEEHEPPRWSLWRPSSCSALPALRPRSSATGS